MATIGNLVVNLSARSDGFNRDMKKSQSTVKRFAATAGKAMAGLVVGFASVAGAMSAYRAAQEQLASERKLEAVLKTTGHAALLTSSQIKAYASELQNVTNFGDEVTISAAAMLATFKEIKGGTFKGALAVAQDMSSVLGTDLKSSILQVGKALNDPIAGLTALTRSGVSFTEQQKEQIRTLQKSGDILGAQNIILGELQSEFGGAAQAMADPWTQAGNAIGDAMEEIGKSIVAVGPIITDLATVAGREIRSIGKVIGEISEMANGLRKLAGINPAGTSGVNPALQGDMSAKERAKAEQALRRERRQVEEARLKAAGASKGPAVDASGLFGNIEAFGSKITTMTEQFKTGMLPAWAEIERHATTISERMDAVTDFNDFTKGLVGDLKVATGSMSQIDRTIAGFAEKGIASGQLDELRKLLEFQEGLNKGPTPFAGAAEKGSAEAFKIIAQSGTNQKQLEVAKKSKELLQKMLDEMRTGNTQTEQVTVQGPV